MGDKNPKKQKKKKKEAELVNPMVESVAQVEPELIKKLKKQK